jgi:hypothetical protein
LGDEGLKINLNARNRDGETAFELKASITKAKVRQECDKELARKRKQDERLAQKERER